VGSWIQNGPAERAADVAAIYDAFATDPLVDGKRIGLWAFSNGGWTAPIVATQRPIAFMILVGTPAETHRHALFIHFFLQMQFGGRSNGPKALRLWIEIVYGQLIVFNIDRCVNRMTILIAIKSRDKVFAGGCR
jgi:hypothetical protein